MKKIVKESINEEYMTPINKDHAFRIINRSSRIALNTLTAMENALTDNVDRSLVQRSIDMLKKEIDNIQVASAKFRNEDF